MNQQPFSRNDLYRFSLAAFSIAVSALLLPLGVCSARADAAGNEANTTRKVDFRYSLPWWQSTINMIDQQDKILVGKEGQLMFDYGSRGKRRFALWVEPGVKGERTWLRQGDRTWLRQSVPDARVALLQTFWRQGEVEFVEETFVLPPEQDPYSIEAEQPGAVILVRMKNVGKKEATVTPVVTIRAEDKVKWDADSQSLAVGKRTLITSTAPITSYTPRDANSKQPASLTLEPQSIPAGGERAYAVAVSRQGKPLFAENTLAQAVAGRQRAVRYWTDLALPYDVIQVPDAGIQAILQSSIRNIHQARDIRDGLPAYHVGPTCYRRLYIVDGAFILEAATMVGMKDDARRGIEYMWTFQHREGGFMDIPNYWKESGIVLWAVSRHAQLTQDKEWLRRQWPKMEKTFRFIQRLRRYVSDDPSRLQYKLLPSGYTDGGIDYKYADRPEFSNTYWNLVGIKAAIDSARWLGKPEQADEWQKEYDDFYAAFRKAAERDMCTDEHGNRYLPIMMGNHGNELPQRGQWSFCHAVYPGKIFSPGDSLVEGNLQMLKDTERQGLVYDTGWLKEGIWTYFASFYGHALLWQGEGEKAADVLYAFANHAAPNMVWREEQLPVDYQGKHREVGDMPHNWGSAEFIRLVSHMIALDRDDELHLFEALPAQWTKPGMATQLKGLATPFGPLTLSLKIADDGKTAALKVEPLSDPACKRIVVHLGGWASDDANASRVFPADQPIDLLLPLQQRP